MFHSSLCQLRIPGYVEGWRYSKDTERALRELCTVNPNRTKRLMEMHKVWEGLIMYLSFVTVHVSR